MIAGIRTKLQGQKTYIVGALLVLQGLYAFLMGEQPTFDNPVAVGQADAIQMILEGLGLGSLRAGVARVTNGS